MCIESKAAGSTYYVNYAEPSTSDNQGYVLIECLNPDGSTYVDCYFWSITASYAGSDINSLNTHQDIYFSNSVMTLVPYTDLGQSGCSYTLSSYTQSGELIVRQTGTSLSSYSISYKNYGVEVLGFVYSGNIGYVSHDFGAIAGDFSVVFNSQGNAIQQEQNDLIEEGNQLQEKENELQEEQNELQKEENETSKGILGSIQEFFGGFFDNLIDSIIGIFVPSSEELSELFDRLNQFFSDTFGFLYYPFEFIIKAFDVFLNSDSSTGLTFPSFSIMGYEVWGDLTYDIGAEGVAGDIFGYVRIGTGAILGIAFVNYLRNFFDKRFGGGGN